jgi:ATP-dependent DNA helicase DinG
LHWFETFTKNFVLRVTPMNIAPLFQQAMKRYSGGRVFTSATLAVNGDFTYFQQQLGLEKTQTLCLPSPFCYEQQSLMYFPLRVFDPNTPDYTKSVVQAAIPVLKTTRGRAFFLFTSFRALREAEILLESAIEYPLLVQGSMPKAILLEKFRDHGHAVLLGTQSFWEGVDIRGEALACVIIDRLPFGSPEDPLLRARIEQLKQEGREPFRDYQLPSAVMALKQGVGRLIRDETDYGVLVICDPRILLKSYGRIFLESLPAMPYTRSMREVNQFFEMKEG